MTSLTIPKNSKHLFRKLHVMENTIGELYSNEYFEYLNNRSKIRKLVRQMYLHDIRKYCKGKTIDFGCGIGELLKILPNGSIGFEVNSVVVEFCKSQGMAVQLYEPGLDNYNLSMVDTSSFSTFTMNHVLEHLENSNVVIEKLFISCHRLGISRIVFTVPGYKGFLSDKTHVTFIDMKYFMENKLLDNPHYKLYLSKYFPINLPIVSQYLTHNELRMVFDIKTDQ